MTNKEDLLIKSEDLLIKSEDLLIKSEDLLIKSEDLLPHHAQPKVHKAKSKLKNKNKNNKKNSNKNFGLFALRDIEIGEPIVIYWGQTISNDEVYHLYTQQRNQYQKISPYIRSGGTLAINGQIALNQTNPNIWGVYVNDISMISSEFLNNRNRLVDNIIQYLLTEEKCNLTVKETTDFPVYCAKKKIYKGEELFVHYGIGYWLNHYGFKPEEIYKISEKVNHRLSYQK